MSRIYLIFIILLSFLRAEEVIYIKNITPDETLDKTYYTGQVIPITYNVMVFNNAIFKGSSFKTPPKESNIQILNPQEAWQQKDDNSFIITYNIKILNTKASVPEFVVEAEYDNSLSSATSQAIKLNILDLKQNKKYTGVIAQNLKVGMYKAKNYDEHNNLIAFELIAKKGNLEDFKLQGFEKQGIERSNFSNDKSSAIFYAIVPKNLQNLSFEYFSTSLNRFELIQIPIVPSIDIVGTQEEDLKPKNTHILYSSFFGGGTILIALALAFFFKRFKKFFILVAIIAAIVLAYKIFYTKTGILESNKQIWILPTHNSTILETTKRPIEIRVIGEHDKFYKIITDEEKVGWIRKEDVR